MTSTAGRGKKVCEVLGISEAHSILASLSPKSPSYKAGKDDCVRNNPEFIPAGTQSTCLILN